MSSSPVHGADLQDEVAVPGEIYAFPLSPAQQRLWFVEQLKPGTPVYNIPSVFRLTGKLNRAALEGSLRALIRRHDSLRTTFETVDGEPTQIVRDEVGEFLETFDLRGLAENERAEKAQKIIDREVCASFDLVRGPLIRSKIIRLDETGHILIINQHHLITDGWSLGVFAEELTAYYRAISTNTEAGLEELSLQYPDFAVWQREWLTPERVKPQLEYWRKTLAGSAPLLELPADRPRPQDPVNRGSWKPFEISKDLTDGLKALSRQNGVSLFTTMLAGFQVLLGRYTRQNDVIVGTPAANRERPELERIIGFFINPIVMRTDLSGDPSVPVLLKRVNEAAQGALANQEIPFDKLVEEIRPVRDLSYHPLFQVMFTLQNAPLRIELDGVRCEPIPFDNGTSKFDLLVELWEEDGCAKGRFEFDADLFLSSTMAGLVQHYQTLLQSMAETPAEPVSRLRLLTEGEEQRLLTVWNDTADPSLGEDFFARFQAVAAKFPDSPAVSDEQGSLTYAQLCQRAASLAGRLRSLGVGADSIVGITLDRTRDLIICVAAVLNAGAAYAPIDPSYPDERRAYMLRDSNAQVLLTSARYRNRFADYPGKILCVDEDQELWSGRGDASSPAAGADDLAYVIYTSGSTGQPKGVALPRRTLSNLIGWQLKHLRPGPGERTLQFASLSFDVSAQEIFTTLCSGGELVMVDDEIRRDPERLAELISARGVQRLFVPFVALQQLAEAFQANPRLPLEIKEVISAGEQLCVTPAVVSLFRRLEGAKLHNHYGPSETHVISAHTLSGPPDKWPSLVPIGKPIGNSQLFILDDAGRPVPAGVPGELFLGGAPLARGYLNRPEQTASVFVANPFGGDASPRMYRTGDLAKWLPDGVVRFLGRIDDQVKIRGFRVELGEVEATLSRHPLIKEAVVTAHGDSSGDRRLVAHYVPADGANISTNELRRFLGETLPDYMTPAIFAERQSWPLTPSGKIDRRSLTPPDVERRDASETYVAPRNDVETRLIAIWEDLLKAHPIGIEDNFFDLGGHSLLAVRLFSEIEKAFEKRLPLATLFKAPTVRQMTDLIRAEENPDIWHSLIDIQPEGDKTPFFCVHGITGDVLWFRDLAASFAPERPFFGFQARGLDGKNEAFESIAKMAAYYVGQLVKFQAEGPYFLGGASLGGIIALEMAQQLEQAGKKVGLLVLFDSGPPPIDGFEASALKKTVESAKNLPFWFANFVHLSSTEMVSRLGRRMRLGWKAMMRKVSEKEEFHSVEASDLLDYANQMPEHRRRMIEAHFRAIMEYEAKRYDGRTLFFRARAQSVITGGPPEKAWRKLIPNSMEVRVVPGTHEGIFKPPNVHTLAAHLKEFLEKAESS